MQRNKLENEKNGKLDILLFLEVLNSELNEETERVNTETSFQIVIEAINSCVTYRKEYDAIIEYFINKNPEEAVKAIEKKLIFYCESIYASKNYFLMYRLFEKLKQHRNENFHKMLANHYSEACHNFRRTVNCENYMIFLLITINHFKLDITDKQFKNFSNYHFYNFTVSIQNLIQILENNKYDITNDIIQNDDLMQNSRVFACLILKFSILKNLKNNFKSFCKPLQKEIVMLATQDDLFPDWLVCFNRMNLDALNKTILNSYISQLGLSTEQLLERINEQKNTIKEYEAEKNEYDEEEDDNAIIDLASKQNDIVQSQEEIICIYNILIRLAKKSNLNETKIQVPTYKDAINENLNQLIIFKEELSNFQLREIELLKRDCEDNGYGNEQILDNEKRICMLEGEIKALHEKIETETKSKKRLLEVQEESKNETTKKSKK